MTYIYVLTLLLYRGVDAVDSAAARVVGLRMQCQPVLLLHCSLGFQWLTLKLLQSLQHETCQWWIHFVCLRIEKVSCFIAYLSEDSFQLHTLRRM
jgi:hypothetical protein